MNLLRAASWALACGILFAPSMTSASAADLPAVRDGWKLELVASSPTIKHPSVVVCAPDGKVFVAEDPMDITRPAHVPEGRILCLHPDGRWTVFAEGLHAVFGMQYLEGKLYVLHNPRLSVFRDADGLGADREELIQQTNPNPWALEWNDHVPANFRLAMDGRFYVAVGDKGIFGAVGRDGKRVDLHGGGILRLRPDGTQLEVFATGVRNILDIGMTDEDEIFTYDNTDENQWMGRVTHMVDGGFYGYPFDFIPRRPYTLWMMADYGAGAATGVTVNNEDALPPEFRGNLFLADFGQRNVRRVQIAREGATFRAVHDEQLFLNPPGDFRPVGVAFSDDGATLYICDWQHRDTKDTQVTGRLWRLRWVGKNHAEPRPSWYVPAASGRNPRPGPIDLALATSHPSLNVRMAAQRLLSRPQSEQDLMALSLSVATGVTSHSRIHAIWAADQLPPPATPRETILHAQIRAATIAHAATGETRVARQAIRQLGNRRVSQALPALTSQLRTNPDPSIRFVASTALGRVGDWAAAEDLVRATEDSDLFARYAAFTALNRIGRGSPDAWPAVIRGLKDDNERIREACAFALRETYDKELVRMLASALRFAKESEREFKLAVLNALAPMHHQPPPWNGEWWAYHPFRLAPPAKTNAWEGTALVLESLSASINDPDAPVRLAAANGLEMFRADPAGDLLLSRVKVEKDPAVAEAILRGLARMKYSRAGGLAAEAIQRGSMGRLAGAYFELARSAGGADVIAALKKAAASDTPDAADAINVLADVGGKSSVDLVINAAQSGAPAKRVAAIHAMARLAGPRAEGPLIRFLEDPSADVQSASLAALSKLKSSNAIPAIVNLWRAGAMKDQAANAAAEIPDVRAVDIYVEGLASKNAALRSASRDALLKIRDAAFPVLEPNFASLPKGAVAELQRIYRGRPDAAALLAIEVGRPAPEEHLNFAVANQGDPTRGEKLFRDRAGVACINCHRVKGEGIDIGPDLSGAGAQFDRRALAESILFPSRAVREGYNVVELELNDGEELSGMVRGETAEVLSLQPATGGPRSIPKQSIKTRRSTPLSLMPDGLEGGLSLEDFADLVSFLESLRSGT